MRRWRTSPGAVETVQNARNRRPEGIGWAYPNKWGRVAQTTGPVAPGADTPGAPATLQQVSVAPSLEAALGASDNEEQRR